MSKIKIEGEYHKEGTQLKGQEITLQIAERKNPTAKKPKHFLRQIRPFQYISSLYPTDTQGKYEVDYSGQKYVVWVSDTTATIQKA